jgi:hypothetical protein
MPTTLQFRRGTTTQNDAFTGAAGELTFDTTLNTIVAHDGTTAGGHTLVTTNFGADITTSGNVTTSSYFVGQATSAQYADLAERYLADGVYEAGHCVVFGGALEITESTVSHDTRVAGVISTAPAYLMNEAEEDGQPVALTGRVPTKVKGPIAKGDLVVTSDIPGVAQKLDDAQYKPGCVIGKSLDNIDTDEVKRIEVVVGRV